LCYGHRSKCLGRDRRRQGDLGWRLRLRLLLLLQPMLLRGWLFRCWRWLR
jgi:hypothetical protein